jgi:hypothetical protein
MANPGAFEDQLGAIVGKPRAMESNFEAMVAQPRVLNSEPSFITLKPYWLIVETCSYTFFNLEGSASSRGGAPFMLAFWGHGSSKFISGPMSPLLIGFVPICFVCEAANTEFSFKMNFKNSVSGCDDAMSGRYTGQFIVWGLSSLHFPGKLCIRKWRSSYTLLNGTVSRSILGICGHGCADQEKDRCG